MNDRPNVGFWDSARSLAVRAARFEHYYGADNSTVRSARVLGRSREEIVGEIYVQEFYKDILPRATGPLELGRPFDVAVASTATRASDLVKRSSLVASRTFLTNSVEGPEAEVLIEGYRSGGGLSTWQSVLVRGMSFQDSGRFLTAALPLIESGSLAYSPQYERQEKNLYEADLSDSSAMGMSDELVLGRRSATNFLDTARTIVAPFDGVVRRRFLEPLLVLELPSVEGTSLADYCKIAVQEAESLEVAKVYLRGALGQIGVGDPDEFTVAVAKLADEIAAGVRHLEAESKRIVRRSAAQAAGASIATVTATLIAVGLKDIGNFLTIIGASGGLWGFAAATASAFSERAKLREEPHYLFWLLSKPKK